ncbi:hypothetical protein [Marinobacterium aestuariivivens]|uniref:Uncharacterized protein n=1 Tax=Marinobacterium aestuariivivens TaxID=1698799 RepID=A0ABW1ZZ92_9GAMM
MMFGQEGEDSRAQQDLARLLMSERFQEEFNLQKGSIPVRQDVPLSRYDDCARLSNRDLKASAANHKLLPSFAHAMAMQPQVSGAVFDVVTHYFNDDAISAEVAARAMATAIKAAQ